MAIAEHKKNSVDDQTLSAPETSSKKNQIVWAVGGGKGGVGKSLISSSLGICLARQGHTVTLVDLDLGGANLHTCVGAAAPQNTLSDFLKGRVPHLESLITPTEIKNLTFLSGANDSLDIAGLDGQPKDALSKAISALPSKYIILDLGAGTSKNTLDFFLQADRQLVSILPEPTSIENAYRFIKAAFYRRLKVLEDHLGVKKILDEAMDHKNTLGIRTPFDLLNYISKIDPIAGKTFKTEIAKIHINLIVNQVRTSSDIEIGNAVKSVCQKYFGVRTDYIGYLDHDNAAWQALRKRRPMLLEYPYSNMVGQFQKITRALTESDKSAQKVV
jgi:flagellar biosynthesis protein FlhG